MKKLAIVTAVILSSTLCKMNAGENVVNDRPTVEYATNLTVSVTGFAVDEILFDMASGTWTVKAHLTYSFPGTADADNGVKTWLRLEYKQVAQISRTDLQAYYSLPNPESVEALTGIQLKAGVNAIALQKILAKIKFK